MDLELPYPPSLNHYWRRVGARTLISKAGRQYREAVAKVCHEAKARFQNTPLALSITAHPPDRRRRDLDNLLKAPLDAMQAAGVYEDDFQFEVINLERGEVVPDGLLVVSIRPSQGPSLSDTSDLRQELARKAGELREALAATLEALESISD